MCSFPSVISNSLPPPGLQHARLLCPQDSPGKTNRVGSCAFLQGIFPIQGLNQGILHGRQILYCWDTGEPPSYFTMLFIPSVWVCCFFFFSFWEISFCVSHSLRPRCQKDGGCVTCSWNIWAAKRANWIYGCCFLFLYINSFQCTKGLSSISRTRNPEGPNWVQANGSP